MSRPDGPAEEDGRSTLGLHPPRSLSVGLLLAFLSPIAIALPRYLTDGGYLGGARVFAWAWAALFLTVTLALLTVGVTRTLAWRFRPDRWDDLGTPRRLGAYALGVIPAAMVLLAASDVGVAVFGAVLDAAMLLQAP